MDKHEDSSSNGVGYSFLMESIGYQRESHDIPKCPKAYVEDLLSL